MGLSGSLPSSWRSETWIWRLNMIWAWCLDAIWGLFLRTQLLASGAIIAFTTVAMAGASCKFYVSTKRTCVRYHAPR